MEKNLNEKTSFTNEAENRVVEEYTKSKKIPIDKGANLIIPDHNFYPYEINALNNDEYKSHIWAANKSMAK